MTWSNNLCETEKKKKPTTMKCRVLISSWHKTSNALSVITRNCNFRFVEYIRENINGESVFISKLDN